jgi:acyl CoA:acetate/3-ketoacid CoA transferase alpha subunit
MAYANENIHQYKVEIDLVLDTHSKLNFEDSKQMEKRGVLIGFISMGNMMSALKASARGIQSMLFRNE